MTISNNEIRTLLSERAACYSPKAVGVTADEFAEHILRNYSVEQRALLGDTPLMQAHAVIQNRSHSHRVQEPR